MAFPEFARSHFPKNTNPKMVNRNRRMLGIFIPFKIYNGFDHDYGGMLYGFKLEYLPFFLIWFLNLRKIYWYEQDREDI